MDYGFEKQKSLGRVFKIPWPVLRRDKASGFVARRSKIHEGYSPSSRLAIRLVALAIPFPRDFENTP